MDRAEAEAEAEVEERNLSLHDEARAKAENKTETERVPAEANHPEKPRTGDHHRIARSHRDPRALTKAANSHVGGAENTDLVEDSCSSAKGLMQ